MRWGGEGEISTPRRSGLNQLREEAVNERKKSHQTIQIRRT